MESKDRNEFIEDTKTLIIIHILSTIFIVIAMPVLMNFAKCKAQGSRSLLMNIAVTCGGIYLQYFILKNAKYLAKKDNKANNKLHNYAVITSVVFTVLIILNEIFLVLWYLGYTSPYNIIFNFL